MVAKRVKALLEKGWQVFADRQVSAHVPYSRPYENGIVRTKNGCLVSTMRLNGFSFETADLDEINRLQINRNAAFRAVASIGSFSIYTHVVRHRVRPQLNGDFANAFMEKLDQVYQRHISRNEMFVNDTFISLVVRPMFAKGSALGRLAGARETDRRSQERIMRDKLVEARTALMKALDPYGPQLLKDVKRFEVRHGDCTVSYRDVPEEGASPEGARVAWFSQQAEFFHLLVNGAVVRPMQLGSRPLDDLIPASRISIGNRTIRIEGQIRSEERFGAVVSLKDYPPETGAGMLDYVLKLPHEMIVTQSLSMLDDVKARNKIDLLDRQISKASEAGSSIQADLNLARDQIARKYVAFAEHHLTVMPIARSIAALDDAVAEIGAQLGAIGASYKREDFNCEPAYWAQLPGNHDYIARRAVISTLNFAGLSSFHAYPYGRPEGNFWGPAITIFETTSGTPFFFNFHERDVGHATFFGPTGAGKTVVMAFLIAQAHRVSRKLKTVIFDKDRGLDVMVRAVGGTYLTLEPGKRSGWNPFMLENTAENRSFLNRLLGYMLKPENGTNLSSAEDSIIDDAVKAIMKARPEMRRLSSIKPLLEGRDRHSKLSERLEKWIGEGTNAWLFDNADDLMTLEASCIGFDMTSILDDKAVRSAALMYMFHRLDDIYDGSPVINLMDEAWKLLDDEVFSQFIRDYLKTLRKRNGLVIFGTQSASDVVDSSISRTIIEQTSTNIFFGNSKADKRSYREHFGLSESEFEWVKNADPANRFMLIKHAKDSVIARLDMSHMMDFVKVLSGREETVAECEALRAAFGDDPANWLAKYCGWPAESEERDDKIAA